jgi:hypothetical protein
MTAADTVLVHKFVCKTSDSYEASLSRNASDID